MFKREVGYTIILYVLWEFLVSSYLLGQFIVLAWLGLVGLLMWIVMSYIYYSERKVSRFSEVILRLQLKRRWYQYIMIPVMFYVTTVFFLFVVRSTIFQQFIILTNSVLFFILMVHIRGSYEKLFTVARGTKVVFDLISIMVFFMLSNFLVFLGGLNHMSMTIIMTAITCAMLLSSLRVEERLGKEGFLWSLVGAVSVGVVAYWGQSLNMSVYPFVLTLTFYLLVSFWHIRLNGQKKVADYISPLLFTLMALILLLS